MCNHAEVHMIVFDDRYSHSQCAYCGITMMRVQQDQNDKLYTFVPAHQCENCDQWYTTEPVPYPDPDSKHAKSTFCCDECAREAYEEVLVCAREDAREYEMWGADYDSWYR